jgi:Mitochondrial glycoprotein
MLSERGITRKFTEQLVEVAGVLDHQCYVTFLEHLRNFVLCRRELSI